MHHRSISNGWCNGVYFLSLRTITASESSILTFTNPLLVVIFATIFTKVRYRFYQWIGVVLGLIGVIITMGAQIELKIGLLFGLLSAVFWAIATLLVKTWGMFFDTWVLSAYQMLFGGLLLLLGSAVLEQPYFIVNPQSLLILFWLSIFLPSFNLQAGTIFFKIVIQEKQVPIYF